MGNRRINFDAYSRVFRQLWQMMNPCILCPRNCRINRSEGKTGFCGIPDMPIVSSVGPHFGEESVLVGRGGSGTIFFAGCNLGCVFCQNYDISHLRQGQEVTIEELAGFMLDLQDYGCVNINFVTPTHVVPAIVAGIETARKKGLNVPTVYNSGGYDCVDTLKLLDGYMDIYMPDMKFSDSAAAKEFANAADYPEINFAAVKEMHRQVGDLKIERSFTAEDAETAEKKLKIISANSAVSAVKAQGLAKRGLLVRHLVLPNGLAGSFKIIDFLAEQVSRSTAINIMNQYRPCYKASSHSSINRIPTPDEIEQVRQYAFAKGLNVIC